MSEAKGDGQEELPYVRGQGRRPRPEARAAAGRGNPTPKEWWLPWRRRA